MRTEKKYDYLVVGAGLFGATFTSLAISAGKSVLVVDKREHVGGNVRTECIEGINVHKYGAHIFHTDDTEVYEYVCRYAEMKPFVNSPIAAYGEERYHLPFNMNTFKEAFGVTTPEEARRVIAEEIAEENISEPKNLEEAALSTIGRTLYEKLVKGYTEKQWGRSATELPPFIFSRVPLRFTYNNSYFNDRYQAIPVGGYSAMIDRMLSGADVMTGTDYLLERDLLDSKADVVIYTGAIDEYFGYSLGALEYRSLKFDHRIMDVEDYQGNAVVNYTSIDVPYTRTIEHKHFEGTKTPKTVVTFEYPDRWTIGKEPFYPVNDEKNTSLYRRYRELADKTDGVYFKGRLGEYKYYDMDDVIRSALDLGKEIIE